MLPSKQQLTSKKTAEAGDFSREDIQPTTILQLVRNSSSDSQGNTVAGGRNLHLSSTYAKLMHDAAAIVSLVTK
jgi:hypothetical protein